MAAFSPLRSATVACTHCYFTEVSPQQCLHNGCVTSIANRIEQGAEAAKWTEVTMTGEMPELIFRPSQLEAHLEMLTRMRFCWILNSITPPCC